MKWEHIIKKDGKVITTVLDRGQQQCSKVRQITGKFGREISDEQIGPEGDDVHEIQT